MVYLGILTLLVCLSVCLFVCMSVCLSVCLFGMHLLRNYKMDLGEIFHRGGGLAYAQ